MSLRKTEAIVLRRVYFSDSSLILSFLTREDGLVEAIAKGCRRERSPLYGRLDYCMEGELVYYEKSGGALHIVSEFAPAAERIDLRSDLSTFSAAAFFCEISSAFTVPDQPAPDQYALLQKGLDLLEDGAPVAAACLAFGLLSLNEAGLSPAFSACTLCGCELADAAGYIATERGGMVCPECRSGVQSLPISAAALAALKYAQRSGFSGSTRMNLRRGLERETLGVVLRMLEEHGNRRLRSGHYLIHLLERELFSHAA